MDRPWSTANPPAHRNDKSQANQCTKQRRKLRPEKPDHLHGQHSQRRQRLEPDCPLDKRPKQKGGDVSKAVADDCQRAAVLERIQQQNQPKK